MDRRRFLTTAFCLTGVLAAPTATATSAARSARAHAVRRGGTIGRADVEAVRAILDAQGRADERLGGGAGRSSIAEYLTIDATAFLHGRFADAQVRAEMHTTVAELARLAGWKAHDAGLERLAQRYYAFAWRLARETDPQHAAFIQRLMAHQAVDLGHGHRCLHLAESALATADGHADTATVGQLHLAVARTRAAHEDARGARAALADAERHINAHSPGADRPWWSQAMGDPHALLATHTAATLRTLGDPSAEQYLWESVRRWDAATHPRVRALTLFDVGELYVERGDLDTACGAWTQALHLLTDVDSARARDAVARVRRALSPFHRRGIAAAVQTDALAAQWQHSTA